MRLSLKKTRIIAMIMTILFTLASCGGPVPDLSETVSQDSQKTPDSDTLDTEPPAADVPDTESQTPDAPQYAEGANDTAEDALAFVRGLKIGWNLGNTFDASDCTWLNDDLDYESAWCGEKTTEQHIEALKQAGFASIRIPVSWHNHLSDKNSYTISERWLDRVNTIVDYCIDRDMYVIINLHHDNSKEFLYPDTEHLDQSVAYVTAIWEQLSERFRDYDEHLIFEGMNEPRLIGHENEWWINDDNADCRDAIRCINKLAQTFIDTVRASGGNNITRYLMCPGYDASPEGVLNSRFIVPKDPVSGQHRIILSVHAYTPYHFALEQPGTPNWSSANEQDVNDMIWFMDQLYNRYVKKGTPVVIDEFGALDKNGNLSDRVDFTSYYVAAARERGMSCFWWDNNAFDGDGENFGLLDRKTCTWRYPEIVQAMMESAE